MRFGLCTGVEHIEEMKKLGYDYIEGNLSNITEKWSFKDCREIKKRLLDAGLPMEATCCFFPGRIKVMDESVTPFGELTEYVKKALENAAELGLATTVFGSGTARRIPEGMSQEKAHEQALKVLAMMGDIAKQNSIIISIEPLNSKEANLFTTVKEAYGYAAELNHPNVRVLGDVYHMMLENEPWSALEDCADRLQHIHFSHPMTDRRTYPHSLDEYDYAPIAAAIKASKYNERISIEASCNDFATDAPAALAILKKLFA